MVAAPGQRDYMTNGWTDQGQLLWLDQHGTELIDGVGRFARPRAVAVDGRR
jgi:hypothetical protein